MIIGMNHLTLAIRDIKKSFEFYNTVLGLKPLVKWDKGRKCGAPPHIKSIEFAESSDIV
jgi:catechol 2,3-dioxygenase-like lactoylglutathione lyase family enzyme